MAIFIPGMHCAVSGKAIASSDEVVAFPAFVSNQADPLYVFSDAVVHVEAFQKHPLADKVQARYSEFRERNAPKSRLCFICGKQIADPDDYLGLGYLIDDQSHPLFRFNYAHFHRCCLRGWNELPALLDQIKDFDRSGQWKGDGLKWLVKVLRNERTGRP
ncbi:MAG: hypothetical protein J0I10_07915 [Verrucomicrobia bacterium]|nr:hypothetical protein [Verrucomicrobiota bacterium]